MRRPKLSEEEKQRRRHERSAARKNAKVEKEIPLFAGLVEKATADTEFWHWRRNKGLAAENTGHRQGREILDELRICQCIRPFVRSLVGDEMFEKLDAHCQRVFQHRSYGYTFWLAVLTGKRIVFGYKRIPVDEEYMKRYPMCGGIRVVEDGVYHHQHMTKEEFYAKFPYKVDMPWEYQNAE